MRIDFVPLRVALLALVAFAGLGASPALAQSCSGDARIDNTLPTGSRWDMCWNLDTQQGVVLSDIYFTPAEGQRRRVLTEASLAQVHLRFVDGSPAFDALTDIAGGGGFGAPGNVATLSSADCSGTLRSDSGNAVLCERTARRGYAYKYYSTVQQGHTLILESRAVIGVSVFVVRWRFADDGSIEPSVGLTGELPALTNDARYGWPLDQNARVGVAFHASYHWRLDFDLGSNAGNDLVEQIEVRPTSDRDAQGVECRHGHKRWRASSSTRTSSAPGGCAIRQSSMPTAGRSRITSSRCTRPLPIPLAGASAWHQHDLHVTRYNACEKLVNDNDTSGGCGSNVTDFVIGESVNPGNVVLVVSDELPACAAQRRRAGPAGTLERFHHGPERLDGDESAGGIAGGPG